MTTSKTGLALIAAHESLRLKAYLCPTGVPTIGYGHTKGVRMGDTITPDQADKFLREDSADAEKAVNAQGLKINQNQFDALVSFTFNVGVGNFGKSTLLKKVKANADDPAIRNEFARWNKGGGKVLPGLTRRRKEEADLYFKK